MILGGGRARLPPRGPGHRRRARHPGPARAPARGAAEGRRAHRRFRDERSDFVGLLELWALRSRGREEGHVAPAPRLPRQLPLVPARARVGRGPPPARGRGPRARPRAHEPKATGRAGQARSAEGPARDRATPCIARSSPGCSRRSATGTPSTASTWAPGRRASRSTRRRRSRASRPAWVMAFELVETTQLFARTAAKIEPEWLLEAAPHLLKRSYADPHWSERSARACDEGAGDALRPAGRRDRSVDYASVAPAEARRMFLDHALVRGEYRTRGAFQEQNRALLAEVARLRDKARRSDMLADDDALLAFFDRRVPAERGQRQDVRSVARGRREGRPGRARPLARGRPRRRPRASSPPTTPTRSPLHGVRLPLDLSLRSVGRRRRRHPHRAARPLAAARARRARLDDPGVAPGEDRRAPPRAAEGDAARARGSIPELVRGARAPRSFPSPGR